METDAVISNKFVIKGDIIYKLKAVMENMFFKDGAQLNKAAVPSIRHQASSYSIEKSA